MDSIISMGEKSLFMRTASILVCSDDRYINGVSVALEHDEKKDPAHNIYLDTFYEHKITTEEPNADKTFYEELLGSDTGECSTV